MISIFTPTYNRAKLLPKLKQSIDRQTCMDFEWIIVDDGSSDETEQLLNLWKQENHPYKLITSRQENQGKHIAFNQGIQLASTEWLICVDSDDQLTDDAVAIMSGDIKNIDVSYVGIVYPRKLQGFDSGTQWQKIDGYGIDIMDLKEVYRIPESAILLRRNVVLKLPFPKYEGEKFLPESWLYQKLMKRGKFYAVNKCFYISEYQAGGLTSNVWKLWKNNPQGILNVLREKYTLVSKYSVLKSYIAKAKILINIDALCMATGKKVTQESPSKFKAVLLWIPSVYFYKRRFCK